MATKKKKRYDDDEDAFFRNGEEQGEEPQGATLEDFVVVEKVDAFCRAYQPATEETPGREPFDDARLREVFKAYVCSSGDPLRLYVEMLAVEGGFHMQMSVATGEPTIYAVRRMD